jgi:hypothetical protein
MRRTAILCASAAAGKDFTLVIRERLAPACEITVALHLNPGSGSCKQQHSESNFASD